MHHRFGRPYILIFIASVMLSIYTTHVFAQLGSNPFGLPDQNSSSTPNSSPFNLGGNTSCPNPGGGLGFGNPGNGNGGSGGGQTSCPATSSALTSQPNQIPAAGTANPINVLNGNKYKRQSDLGSLTGELSLEFVRHYNSQFAANLEVGVGWSHSYSVRIKPVQGLTPNEHSSLSLVQADGRTMLFERPDNSKATPLAKNKPAEPMRSGYLGDGELHTSAIGYKWQWPNGRVLSFDERGFLSSIEQGALRFQVHRNHGGNLSAVTDAQGRRMAFRYEQGYLASMLFNGKETFYQYSRNGQLLQVTRPDGRKRQYQYNSKHSNVLLTGIVDERGILIEEYRYNAQKQAVYSAKANGVEAVEVTFEEPVYAKDNFNSQRKTRVTNTEGGETVYHIDTVAGRDRVVEVSGTGCAACATTGVKYKYNERLQVVEKQVQNGNKIFNDYDDKGRTLATYEQLAGGDKRLLQSFEYSDESMQPKQISSPSVAPNKQLTQVFEYTPSGLVSRVTERGYAPRTPLNSPKATSPLYVAIERSVNLTYNNRDQLISIDGAQKGSQDTITLSYNQQQQLSQISSADGRSQRILAYNNMGLATKIQTGEQTPVSIRYNAFAKPEMIERGALRIEYQYDAVGNLISITEPNGQVLSFKYDDANRTTELASSNGPTTQIDYNLENQISQRQQRNSLGKTMTTVQYFYDAQQRFSRSVNTQTGQERSQYYNEQGDLVAVASNGAKTQVESSPLKGFLTLVQPGNVSTQFLFDAQGRNTGLVDANGNTTQGMRDDFGQTVQRDSADTGRHYYHYDAVGNRIASLNESGQKSRYKYDAANRLIQSQSPTGSIEFSYDGISGKIKTASNAAGNEYFVYDKEARLIEHRRSLMGLVQTFSTQYQYNDLGRLSQKILPDGQTLNYEYYAKGPQKGQLKTISRQTWLGLSQSELLGGLDSNPWDGEIQKKFGNGIVDKKQFNSLGQLDQIDSDVLTLKYNYTKNGNIKRINTNGKNHDYQYDGYNRLSQAVQDDKIWQYRYDKVGNRTASRAGEISAVVKPHSNKNIKTQKADETRNITFTYKQALAYQKGQGNRLQTIDKKKIDYNPEGSPLTLPSGLGQKRYEYNAQQRPLKLYIDGQLKAEYTYNSFGERIKKTVYSRSNTNNSDTSYYLYENKRLSAEVNQSGEVTAQYLYYQQKPAIKLEGSTAYYIHTDHLGTPRAATDEDKNIVWQANYSPFGKAEITTEQISLNLRFPGQYQDDESGSHYNYFRDYDPELGRYLSSDPIGLSGGVNTFAYVRGNPIERIDPLGLYDELVHYYMTYFLAVTAGMPVDKASIMALATQYVDDNSLTSPLPSTLEMAAILTSAGLVVEGSELYEALKSYHFTMNYDDGYNGDSNEVLLERFENPGSDQLGRLRDAAMLYGRLCRIDGISAEDTKLQLYGEFLHAYEDTFSHRDRNNKPYSIFNIGDDNDPSGVIGHAFIGESGGHAADHTYNQLTITDPHYTQPGGNPTWSENWEYNELRTLRMQKEVYNKLITDFGLQPEYSWADLAGDGDAKIGAGNYGNCNSCWTNGKAPRFESAESTQGVLQKFNAFDERTNSYTPTSGPLQGFPQSGNVAKIEILNDFLRNEDLPPIPNYAEATAAANRSRLLDGLSPIDGLMLP